MLSGTPLLEARAVRRRIDVAQHKRKVRKIPPQIPPKGLERSYTRDLLRIVRRMTNAVENSLFGDLPAIAGEAEIYRPDSEETRLDSAAALIAAAIAKTQIELGKATTDLELTLLTEQVANQISNYNQRQVNKVFRSAIGIDLISSEVMLQPEIQAFVGENVALIKSIESGLLSDVEQTVFRGARQGLRHEQMAKNVRQRFGVTRNRAKLIARDQVNKFNGKLTEVRQKAAGVKSYIWRTVRDARVRPEHASLEGEKFSWDKPPSEGHPGEPIQCRCFAEPVLSDILGEEYEPEDVAREPLDRPSEEVNKKEWAHVTNEGIGDKIKQEGFQKSQNSIFGSGVYLTEKPASIDKKKEVVRAKVKTKKILETDYIEFPKKYEKLTGKKHAGISGEEVELQKLGFDGVRIKDEGWLVIFDPAKVTVTDVIKRK